jgi:hypothetical protein
MKGEAVFTGDQRTQLQAGEQQQLQDAVMRFRQKDRLIAEMIIEALLHKTAGDLHLPHPGQQRLQETVHQITLLHGQLRGITGHPHIHTPDLQRQDQHTIVMKDNGSTRKQRGRIRATGAATLIQDQVQARGHPAHMHVPEVLPVLQHTVDRKAQVRAGLTQGPAAAPASHIPDQAAGLAARIQDQALQVVHLRAIQEAGAVAAIHRPAVLQAVRAGLIAAEAHLEALVHPEALLLQEVHLHPEAAEDRINKSVIINV